MALSEFESARVRKSVGEFVERRRPPPQIRSKLDIGFRLTGQSVELFEIRPLSRGTSESKHEHPFAKATYVRTKRRWRIFWLRQDLKWHSYTPVPEVNSIDEFVALVQEDEHGCFFG